MDQNHVIAINPGSTSTKVAVYENKRIIFSKNIIHSTDELSNFPSITEQYTYRKELIFNEIRAINLDENSVGAVVGRGGLIRPITSGVYSVNEKMITDLRNNILGEHASNLGGLIAYELARLLPNAKAYIADPIVVDEMQDVARICGHPLFERISIFHALNHKAVGKQYANSLGIEYKKLNLIIAHLGGGITIGAHKKGKVIDVNNGLDGEGPFSPERSGTLPIGALVRLCFSGTYTYKEIKQMIKGKGGYVAHLNTNNGREVENNASKGDKKSILIQKAMGYQIGKYIGSMATVLEGKVDAIILTGGLAHNRDLTNYIKNMVAFIAPVILYPGEDEMYALAMSGQMVLQNKLKPKVY